jgi:2-methylcitrate dehydratase PrpD
MSMDRDFMSAGNTPLPEAAMVACKHRIFDTSGVMVSGARMRPGTMAANYVHGLGGEPQATANGSSVRTTSVSAALTNAMCANSDETDDFEPVTKAHPGSSVVPAALAVGEHQAHSGEAMIRAVALGYPIETPLDALLSLRERYGLTPDNVRSIVVRIPSDAEGIVGDSAMPGVNCQHLVAFALVKGAVSFRDSHDVALMHDPAIVAQRAKVTVQPDPSLMDPIRLEGDSHRPGHSLSNLKETISCP